MGRFYSGLVALLALVSFPAWAACTGASPTWNCPSGSTAADVQTVVTAAVDGDTVNLAAGNYTWSTFVTILNKNINVIGAGIDVTNISINNTNAWLITQSNPAKASWRLSGMTLNGTFTAAGNIITLDAQNQNSANSYGWRIDHIKFDYPAAGGGRFIIITGVTYGLVDHIIGNGGQYVGVHLQSLVQGAQDSTIQGTYAHSLPMAFGTQNAVYVEDSTFGFTGAGQINAVNDMVYGGRMVFRHNVVTDGFFQSHGARANSPSSNERGGSITYEVYNNTWTGITFYRWAQVRSGTGVVWDNTVSGYTVNFVELDDQRADFTNCSSGATTGVGRCDGSNVAFDGNIEANGWPCMDQVGRNATQAFGSQSSNPAYGWNNGSTATCATGGACDQASGLRSDTACASVSFPNGIVPWVKGTTHSNGDVDFINNGSTPKPGYVPFTYPHPLQSSSGPTNLHPIPVQGYDLFYAFLRLVP